MVHKTVSPREKYICELTATEYKEHLRVFFILHAFLGVKFVVFVQRCMNNALSGKFQVFIHRLPPELATFPLFHFQAEYMLK